MPLITMTNISKEYRWGETVVQALRGLDLTIERGEFVAIWGKVVNASQPISEQMTCRPLPGVQR